MSNAGNSRERMKKYLDAYWEIQRDRNAQEQQQESVGERAKKTANGIANALQFAQKVQSASRTLDNAEKLQDVKSKRMTNMLLAGGDQRKAATIAGQEDQTQTLQDAYNQYIRNMMRPGQKRTFRQENDIQWAQNQIDKAEKNAAENSEYTDMLKSYVDMSKELSKSLGIEKYGGMTQQGYDTFNDTMWYASQGPEQAQNVATAIHLGTGTTAREDDQTFSWDASKGSVIDYEGYIPVLRETGYYDTPEYAKSDLRYLASSDYLTSYIPQLQQEIKEARKRQEEYEKKPWIAADWQRFYWDMRDQRYDEETLWEITDWIMKGERYETFSPVDYELMFEEMSEEEIAKEKEVMKEQYESLDWLSFGETDYDYRVHDSLVNETKELEKQEKSIRQELENRARVDALESAARGAEDFETLSSYTDDGNGYTFMADGIQSYVNNRPNKDIMINAYNGAIKEKKWVENGYSFLTDREIAVYNYYYNKDKNRAQEYLDALQPTLWRRMAKVETNFDEAYARGWTAPLAYVNARWNNLKSIGDMPIQMYHTIMGDEDPNAYYFRSNRVVNNTYATQMAELAKLGGPEIFGKTLLQNLYGGVTSAVDNGARIGLGAAMTGGFGAMWPSLAMAGAQAASGSLYETAGDREQNPLAKAIKATANGAIEIGTERIGLEALFKMGKPSALAYLKGVIAAECGEEMLAYAGDEIAEALVDTVFSYEGDKKTLTEHWNEIGQTLIETVISSALMGAPGTIKTRSNIRNTGTNVQNSGDVAQLIDIGAEMGETSEAGILAQKMKNRMENGKGVTNYQLGQLTMMLNQELTQEQAAIVNDVMDEAIAGRMVEMGATEEAAKRNASAVRKIANGEKLSARERMVTLWDNTASQVVKELTSKTGEDAENAATEEVSAQDAEAVSEERNDESEEAKIRAREWREEMDLNILARAGKTMSRIARFSQATTTKAETDVTAAANRAEGKTSEKNRTGKNMTGRMVAFTDGTTETKGEFLRFEKQDGEMKAVVNVNGKETLLRMEDLTDEGGIGTATIIEYTQEAKHDISAVEANTMMATYQRTGGNAKYFIQAFEDIYASGYAGIEAPKTSLDTDVASIIYEQGMREGEADESRRVERAKEIRNEKPGTVTWLGMVKKNAEIGGAENAVSIEEAIEDMTESQRTTAEVVQAMARELNLNMVLFQSSDENIQNIADGKYDPGTNTVYIDINSGTSTAEGIRKGKNTNTIGYAMMVTLGHELTHHIESTSAEGYAKYKAAVKEQLKESGEDWTQLVRQKIDDAIRNGMKLTRMGAEAEVVADASEYMLQESSFVQKMDATLGEKVKTFVHGFVEKVKAIFHNIAAIGHRESNALRQTVDGVMKYTANLQELWDASLEETVMDIRMEETGTEDTHTEKQDDETTESTIVMEETNGTEEAEEIAPVEEAADTETIAEEEENTDTTVFEDDMPFSTRNVPDSVSVREYLSNLEISDDMTDTEKELLGIYKKRLEELREAEDNVRTQEEDLKNVTGQDAVMAKNRLDVYKKRAEKASKDINRLESENGFAGIMANSRELVNNYLLKMQGSLSEVEDRLESEIRSLTQQLQEVSAKVQETEDGQKLAAIKGMFNVEDLKKAAQEIRKKNNSRMSAARIADRMALAWAELYGNQGETGVKRFAEAAQELAQDIIRSSGYRTKSSTLQILREEMPTISLTESEKQEIQSRGLTLAQYKRALAPYVQVTEGGNTIDAIASANAYYVDTYGGVSLYAVIGTENGPEMAMALYDVVQREKASEMRGAYEGMTEEETMTNVMADIAAVNLHTVQDTKTVESLRNALMKYAGESERAAQAINNAIQTAQRAQRATSGIFRETVKASEMAKQAVDYYRALEKQRMLLELKEQKQQIRKQLNGKAAQKIAKNLEKLRSEYKEREKKAREYRQTRDEVNKLRRGIGRKVKRLNTLRVNETDSRHVPQELQHVADLVMQTFTSSSLAKLAFSRGKTAQLAQTYKSLLNSESDMTYYWDDEIEEEIINLQELSERYNSMMDEEGIRRPGYFTLEGVKMENEILQGVDSIVSNVMRMIDSANESFIEGKKATYEQFSGLTAKELLKRNDARVLKGKLGEVQKGLDELIRTGNMTPIYFFEHFRNDQLMELFNGLRKGQTDYAHILLESKAYMTEMKQKYHYASWVKDGVLNIRTHQGHEITLTREQAMWVYATAKREASNELYQTEHLQVGGFQFRKGMKQNGLLKKTDNPHTLSEADIRSIGEWLTDQQKAYADSVVEYLSTTMAEYGNNASMAMYGYRKFKEAYYFPFETKADQRFLRGDEGASGESAETGRLKNAGFTHKVQYKASATLWIDDFTTVAANHINKMANYAAMVEPIENLKRVLNYKVTAEDGSTQTIRALIGTKYGKASQDYLQNFLKDLNGAVQGDNRATKISDFLIRAFKSSAVMTSLSVVLQQPTAVFRAMWMLDPKYFTNNPFYRPSQGVWDELMAHSGTAIIKDMGRFDMGMGMTAAEYIEDTGEKTYEAWKGMMEELNKKGSAFKSEASRNAAKKTIDKMSAMPALADKWTWGFIWEAVKKETAELNPDMDPKSNEFLDKAGKRFDDIMDHTQVYDSLLTRSNLMRSKNPLHKMATAFMAEPTLSLNVLFSAFRGNHSKATRVRMCASVMGTCIMAGLAAALVQAWNDEDDDRNWLEKFADKSMSNILDNINPIGMMPYIQDIYSLCQGYNVERADMSVFTDIINGTYKFFDTLRSGEQPTWKQWENFAGNWANLTGIPLKNISREIRRGRNLIFHTDFSAPNMNNVGYTLLDNLPFYDEANSAYYDRIAASAIQGDEKETKNLLTYMTDSKGASEEAIRTGVRKALKVQYEDGNMDKQKAQDILLKNGWAKDTVEAFDIVDKWEEGTDNYSHYNTLKESLKANDGAKIKESYYELVEAGLTKEQVFDEMWKTTKKLFMSGDMTESMARSIYSTYAAESGKKGMTENELYWTFDEWNYGKKNGGDTEGYRKYDKLFSAVETGKDLKNVISVYTSNGVSNKVLASQISEKYRPIMQDLYKTNRTEYANLQARLLTAYQVLGYDRNQKIKDIQKWVK